MEQRRPVHQTPRGGLLAKLKAVATELKRNIATLHLAAGDPRTPARLLIGESKDSDEFSAAC